MTIHLSCTTYNCEDGGLQHTAIATQADHLHGEGKSTFTLSTQYINSEIKTVAMKATAHREN